MKKTLLFGLLLTAGISFSQILYEPFDYTVGETLTGKTLGTSVWENYSGGSPDDMLIVAEPSWADFGLPASTGNAVNYKGGGSDLALPFDEVSSGVVYYSVLLQIDQYNTAGTHDPYRLIHLRNASGNTGASIYIDGVDGDDTKFVLGASGSDVSSETVWSSTQYDMGSQHLVVVSYDLDDAEKTMKMWIDPTVSATEPTNDLTVKPASKLRSEFASIAFQASSNARTPETTVDELRVATSWAEVVGMSSTASTADEVFASKLSVYPNPASGLVNITAADIALTSVQVFNMLGKQVYASKAVPSIDVSSFAKGVYFLKLNADGASATKKLIVE